GDVNASEHGAIVSQAFLSVSMRGDIMPPGRCCERSRVMGQPASDIDLPDPLESSEDHRVGNSEDLLSQLAGDAVNRMMAENAVDPPPPRLNPVQELTSQLDTFFEELRQRQAETAAAVDAIPDANPIEINDAERAALD